MACRRLTIAGILLVVTPCGWADERYGPRLRFGRVQFGVPVVDALVTAEGDRTTTKLFSRGDMANIHSDDGRQTNVGIRSLVSPRGSLRGAGAQPGRADAVPNNPPIPDSAMPAPAAIVDAETEAETRSRRAEWLIDRGEQARDPGLLRQGLEEIHRAIRLRKQAGRDDLRDYLIWMRGVNQLAVLETDSERAAANAAVVDDFATAH